MHAIQPWKIQDRQTILSAPPWLTVFRERVELPSGRVIDDFYRVVLPDFAVVVPFTPDGQIVVVRGYKHGIGRINLSPPAGLVNPGETPRAAAERELLEETGYATDKWRFVGSYVVDGNRQCGTMHLFLAHGVRRLRPPQADDMEELLVELISRERLLQALQSGEIGNLAGACGIAAGLLLT